MILKKSPGGVVEALGIVGFKLKINDVLGGGGGVICALELKVQKSIEITAIVIKEKIKSVISSEVICLIMM